MTRGNTIVLVTVDDLLWNDPCAIENNKFRRAVVKDLGTKEIYHSMGLFKAGCTASCAHANSVFRI